MSTPMDVSVLLIWEGAHVLGALVLRAVCLRLMDPDDIPIQIRKRVRMGTRLAPSLAALSLAMIAIGIVIRFAP